MYRINLLPPELRQDTPVDVRSVVRQAMVMTVIVLVVMGLLAFWWLVQGKEREAASLQQRAKQLQQQVLQVQQLQKQRDQRRQQVASLEELVAQQLPWSQLLRDINDSLPQDTWFTRLTTGQDHTLIIQGMAGSLTSVGVLMYQLQQLEHISQVSLRQAEEEQNGDVAVIRFELLARLAGKGGKPFVESTKQAGATGAPAGANPAVPANGRGNVPAGRAQPVAPVPGSKAAAGAKQPANK